MRYCERATATSSVRGGRAQTEHRQRERERERKMTREVTTQQQNKKSQLMKEKNNNKYLVTRFTYYWLSVT